MAPSAGDSKHRKLHTPAPRKTRWARDEKRALAPAQANSVKPPCSTFLEKIPVELRLMIYDYAFATELKNDLSAQIRREIRARDLGTDREHAYFEPALLQTCRTIRNEAMKPYCYFLAGKQVQLSSTIIKKWLDSQRVNYGIDGRHSTAFRENSIDFIVCERHSDEGFLMELRHELGRVKRFEYVVSGAFQAWEEELDVSETILSLHTGKYGYRPPHLDVSRALLVQRLHAMGQAPVMR